MMEPITSYAQNFEDVMLWRALGHVENGLYVDVGAQSPIVDSVSMGFFEKGWRGIHIDANPTYAAELRAARPDDTVLEALVSKDRGIASFHAIEGTGLSTVDPDIATAHLEGSRFQERVVPVPMVTLDDVFDLVPASEIHWLKIDVEGGEVDVLEGWRSARRPWVVVVESVHPVTRADTFSGWEHHLTDRGYAFVYADGLNRFYVHGDHSDLTSKFAVPPNVFDLFRLSGTATSSFSNLLREAARSEAALLGALKDEAVAAREAAEEALCQAREQIDSGTRHREGLELELRERDGTISELSVRLEQSVRENALLSSSIDSKEQELRQLRERTEACEKRHTQLSASLEMTTRELGQLMEQLSVGATERQKLEAAVLEGRALSAQLASQVSSMLHISLQATREARAAAAERDSLATRLFEMRRRISDAASLEQRVHEQQCELSRMSDELERARSHEVALGQQLGDMRVSHSWRLTAPVRMLSSLMRGNVGYARSTVAEAIAQLDSQGFPRRMLRKLAPAGSRLGEASRRRLYGDVGTPVPGPAKAAVPGGCVPGDVNRLLELSGVVGNMQRKLK